MQEIDIKCPCCGQIFQVVEKIYEENADIVCPICTTDEKIFKPEGNELNAKNKKR